MNTTDTIHFIARGLLHEHELDRAICEQLAEQGGVDCEVNIDATDLDHDGQSSLIPLKVRGYCEGYSYTGDCTVAKVGKRTIATYIVNWK